MGTAVDEGFPGTERFQVLARLGAGGTGVVYEAIDRQRNTRVALKTLRALSPDALLRFKHEFRSLQDLHHPNLISLGELIEDGGRWFFTMELVAGADFLAWVNGDVARLRAALVQLARGLGALHAAGKVHRDIKPSNILVTPEGRVALLDFSLVADANRDSADSGQYVVGTAAYMAPEQAVARHVGPPADWYAFGVLLYQALTGRLPPTLEGGAPLDILQRKQERDAAAPSALAPSVPADLDALCRDLLGRDPGARPTGRDVLERLGETPAPDAATPPATPLFVGRRRELHLLDAALAEVERSKQGATVLVHGDSGVGKSALVSRFAGTLAARDDAWVIEGRCYERESVPFKAFDGVIDALTRRLARLPPAEVEPLLGPDAVLLAHTFPVLRRVRALAGARAPLALPDPAEQQARVFTAMRDLLDALARGRLIVLVIDDLQWADADSLALLRAVLSPPAPPLLLLATMRPGAEGAPAPTLAGESQGLHLGALPDDDARELAVRLGAREGELAGAIAREARGHPLFIAELARHAASAAPGARPVRLDEALAQRAAGLDAAARCVLELACVAGTPLARDSAFLAADVSFDDFEHAVALLRAEHLVRTTGARGSDVIEPYHDRVREAVHGALDAAARRAIHERLATALEAAERPDAAALAAHWLEAGDRARAATHALAAAHQAAAALAFSRAARHYRLALDLAPPGQVPEGLRRRYAAALASAGRSAEAGKAFEDAVAEEAPAGVLELRRCAAEQYLRAGLIDEGTAVLHQVLDDFGFRLARTPARALASLLVRRAQVAVRGLGYQERGEHELPPRDLMRIDACWNVATGLSMVDTIRAADFQGRHLLLALRAGEPFRVCRALVMEGAYAGVRGGATWPRTQALLARAGEIAQRLGHPYLLGIHAFASGVSEFLVGHWAAAMLSCDRAREIFRNGCTGVAWELHTSQWYSVLSLLNMGELRDATRRATRLRRVAEERGDLYAAASLRVGLSSLCTVAGGEPDRAREEAKTILERWSHASFQFQHYWATVTAIMADLYEGRGEVAWSRLEASWAEFRRALLFRIQYIHLEALSYRARAALAAAAAGSAPAERLREARRMVAKIRAARMPWSDPHADLAEAGCAALAGDRTRAARLLASAEDGFSSAGARLHEAVARRCRGLLEPGDAGRARVSSAESWMRTQGIPDPASVTRLLAPGTV